MTEDQWIDGIDETSIAMLTHVTQCPCKNTQGCAKCNALRHIAQLLESFCRLFIDNQAAEEIAADSNQQSAAEIDVLALGDAAILPMARGDGGNGDDLSEQQLRGLGVYCQDDEQMFYD